MRRFAVFIAWLLVAQTVFLFILAGVFYGLALVSRREWAPSGRATAWVASVLGVQNHSLSARFRFAPVRIA